MRLFKKKFEDYEGEHNIGDRLLFWRNLKDYEAGGDELVEGKIVEISPSGGFMAFEIEGRKKWLPNEEIYIADVLEETPEDKS